MIVHDISEMDQFDLHRMLGRGEFDDLVEMAKQAPGEIHLFTVPEGLGKVSVALALGDEARADLERRLHGFPWTRSEPEANN